jgi:hypothetical protein
MGCSVTGSILKLVGDGKIRGTALAAWLAAMLLLLTAAAPATASSGPSTTTFADVIARSRLVVLAEVVRRSDGGITLNAERVLKGRAGRALRFAPTLQSAVQPGWARAVVAFTDPTEPDFRAPTIAWHVTAAGVVDPERYQQYPGTPQTLASMLAWFDRLPATDTVAAAGTPQPPDWPLGSSRSRASPPSWAQCATRAPSGRRARRLRCASSARAPDCG